MAPRPGLPVLREVFGDTVAYAADPRALARRLADALGGPDAPGAQYLADRGHRVAAADRRAAGRRLARAHRWDDVARAHLRLYRGLAR